MSETTMTVRTGEQNAEALAKYYKTKSAGAIRAVEGFVQIRKYTLYELKGVFAREEINALKEAQNGIIILPEYQGNKGIFLAHLEYAEMLEGTFTRARSKLRSCKRKNK